MYVTRVPVGDPKAHSDMFPVKMKDPEGNADEYWVYDDETHTIRSVTNSEHILSLERSGFFHDPSQPHKGMVA